MGKVFLSFATLLLTSASFAISVTYKFTDAIEKEPRSYEAVSKKRPLSVLIDLSKRTIVVNSKYDTAFPEFQLNNLIVTENKCETIYKAALDARTRDGGLFQIVIADFKKSFQDRKNCMDGDTTMVPYVISSLTINSVDKKTGEEKNTFTQFYGEL